MSQHPCGAGSFFCMKSGKLLQILLGRTGWIWSNVRTTGECPSCGQSVGAQSISIKTIAKETAHVCN